MKELKFSDFEYAIDLTNFFNKSKDELKLVSIIRDKFTYPLLGETKKVYRAFYYYIDGKE